MNLRTLWTLAIAEMRSCRRLARTWVIIVAALLFCTVWYIDMIDISAWPSPPDSDFNGSFNEGDMTARYTISNLLNGIVAVFSFGMIFLAFDIRARDIQNRVSDVIDSRPAANLEIVIGRLIGIFLLLFIPCLVFLAILTGYEAIAGWYESQHRLEIQPLSVMSLVAWNLIPNLLFFGTLVVCLSVLLRIRLLASLVAVAVLVGSFWINNYIPVRFQESFALFLGGTIVPSDLAPVFASLSILLNRCGIMLLSIALVLFAASMFMRRDRRHMLNSSLGIATVSCAAIVYFCLFAAFNNTENLKEEWVKTHTRQSLDSFPDVRHLEGTVDIRPGKDISLNVALTLIRPTVSNSGSVVFSLNPQYTISKLILNSKELTKSNYSFENGLLTLPSNLWLDGSNKMQIEAKGRPDDRFAYLDQARDFQKLAHKSVRQLGLKNSIFRHDYVALMPGIFWYPVSGSAVGRDQIEIRSRDLFTTDLKVTVPRDWQVATVGNRQVTEDLEGSTFRFQSSAPVPEIALFATDFDHRGTVIEGVGFEILFSRKHLDNLNVLTIIEDLVEEWVAERIKSARAVSLDYPYDNFYIVEVPSNLRIYGGGWQMDTVLQPPGMMLIRESSFPTEQFKNVTVFPRRWGWVAEEDLNTFVFDQLLRYFGDDLQGGSPFTGIARNFVSHQLSATGRGAVVLQFLIDQLANQLVTQTESGSIISMREYEAEIPYIGINPNAQSREDTNVATEVRELIAALPSTREILDQFALLDLDFNANPISSYRVLLTKGYVLAESMIVHFGPERIGSFLNQLLTNFNEKSVTIEDFLSTASEVGMDFDEWVLSWLEDKLLPGFHVEPASVSKIESEEYDEVEYQTTFILHNAEPISGYVRVLWTDFEEYTEGWGWGYDYGQITSSDPIFVRGRDSKRFSIKTARPIQSIWIDPFLAYNRTRFEVLVSEFEESSLLVGSPLPFVSEVDWQPTDSSSIVVDDLDPNFSIVTRNRNSGEYAIANTDLPKDLSPDKYDQGLRMETYPRRGEWNRLYDSSSYGLYRRTHARTARGDQSSAARFVASLPHEGVWMLELYVPKPVFRERYYDWDVEDIFSTRFEGAIRHRRADPSSPDEHYSLQILNGDFDQTETFDIANAKVGWNEVGKFEIGTTEVEVLLSDWAGHKDIMVYADAIRWSPVSIEDSIDDTAPEPPDS